MFNNHRIYVIEIMKGIALAAAQLNLALSDAARVPLVDSARRP